MFLLAFVFSAVFSIKLPPFSVPSDAQEGDLFCGIRRTTSTCNVKVDNFEYRPFPLCFSNSAGWFSSN